MTDPVPPHAAPPHDAAAHAAAAGDRRSVAVSERRSALELVGVDVLARTSYGLSRTPLLPLYAASLGAGPALVGAVGAASTVTGIFLKAPAGALSDTFGRRRLLLAGLVVFAAGPFLYLLVPVVSALVAIRLLHGLATAIYSPVSMAAVAALAGDHRGEALSWLSNAKTVGALAGSFLGGVLLSAGVVGAAGLALRAADAPATASPEAFRNAWLVAGAFGVAALAVGVRVVRRLPADPAPSSRRSAFGKALSGLREVGSDRRVLSASACEAVQNMSVGIVEQFLPIYAVLVAGRSPFEAGLLFGVQSFSTIASKPLFGRLSDTRGRRILVIAGMFACAAPFAALPWVTGLPALVALAVAFGLGEALVTAASAALVSDLCRERSLGTAMGVFGTIGDAGHAAGPLLGGLLLAAWGFSGGDAFAPDAAPAFRWTFGIVAALIALTGALFALRGNGRARGDPPRAAQAGSS